MAMAMAMVSVERDGKPRHAPAREVEPGDQVRLDAGARVPADGQPEHGNA